MSAPNLNTHRLRAGMVGLGMIFDDTYRPLFERLHADGLYRRDFGFVGVEGSLWPRQHYSFSSPAQGIVEPNSIAFPLNQGCGTGFEYTSTVKAWIYDQAGTSSKPVIIHLACTT